MDLRFGGRTLVVTAYVNTSEAAEAVVRRVQPAARGPKMAMVVVTAGSLKGEEAVGLWAAQEIQILFDGRTVVVTVYANTDEDPAALSARVLAAANAPSDSKVVAECQGRLAVVTTVGDVAAEESRAMWECLFRTVNDRRHGPN